MRSRLPVRSAALAAAAAIVLSVVPAAPALAGASHRHRARTHRAPVSRAVSTTNTTSTTATTPTPTSTTPAASSTTPATSTASTTPTTSTTSTPSTTPTTATGTTPTTGGTGARLHARGRAGGLALTVTRHGKLVGGIAHIASLIGASIIDFAFSPATITIHVGDTVTWTNTGKQLHSATANNHSFDTGLLKTGQSASHTFTTAGTYSYICIVHQFMHGTVVVLAAATTTTTTPHTAATTTTPTSTTTTTTPTSTASNGSTLPVTGADLGMLLGFGVTLTGLGLAMRRRVRS